MSEERKDIKLPPLCDFVTCGNENPGVHIFHHWENGILCDKEQGSCFRYTRHKDSPPVCSKCLEILKELKK